MHHLVAWRDAMEAAKQYRRQNRRFLVAQQKNKKWYFLAMYKHERMSTKDFDSGVVDSGVFTGIRVWTTDETNGFDFLNEQHARERILMMFGLDGHKQYKIIATGK